MQYQYRNVTQFTVKQSAPHKRMKPESHTPFLSITCAKILPLEFFYYATDFHWMAAESHLTPHQRVQRLLAIVLKHRGHICAFLVYCYLKISILHNTFCLSAPVHHSTSATHAKYNCKTCKFSYITPLPRSPCWLSVAVCISLKALMLCNEAKHGAEPSFLKALSHPALHHILFVPLVQLSWTQCTSIQMVDMRHYSSLYWYPGGGIIFPWFS